MCAVLRECGQPSASSADLSSRYSRVRSPFWATHSTRAACPLHGVSLYGGLVLPLFTVKMERWRPPLWPSSSLSPWGKLEYSTVETRVWADLCIKARAPHAPALRTRALWHSPSVACRPNPCPVAVAGTLHLISSYPGGATCARPEHTHPAVALRSI